MVELDVETIGLIVGIVVVAAGATAFIVRLQARVNQLEEQFNNHPLLSAFRQYEQDRGVIDFFNSLLESSRVERE